MKIFSFIILTLLPLASVAHDEDDETLFIVGSTTGAQLIKKISAEFSKQQNVYVTVRPIGSEKGIISIAEKVSDMGVISRFLTPEEIKEWPQIKQITIAQDAIVFIANKENPVNTLSSNDIVNLYTGKQTHWQNNVNFPIMLFSKNIGHGTHDSFLNYFNLHSMFGENENSVVFKTNKINTLFSNNDIQATSHVNQAIANVYRNKYALSYESLGAYKAFIEKRNMTMLKMMKLNNQSPLIDNEINPHYSFIRPINLLINKNHDDNVKKFITFLLSEQGQKLIADNYYIPVN